MDDMDYWHYSISIVLFAGIVLFLVGVLWPDERG